MTRKDSYMADNDTEAEFLDLTGNTKMVKITGADAPIPADQLISKAEYTRKTQALAQERQQMEQQYAPAAELVQDLMRDPVGFYRELGNRLGLSPQQTAEMGTQIEQQADSLGLDVNDPRFQQVLQRQMAPVLAELDSMKKFVLNTTSRNSIDAEITQIRQLDPELTQDQMNEILKTTVDKKLPDLQTGYQVWSHARLVGKTAKLAEELEVTKRKAAFPDLGGPSEHNIVRNAPKGKLEDYFAANAKKMGLA